ncbi:hypothetical protein ACLQ85_05120 [Gallibacterium anatis]|uniref:hypothetical protein n=1 Tax=Gallibacterium anatis TaxID=750 RepID=UPI0039FDD38C
MKMTFTKSLLATAIIVGLTACGSGGGGGSNAPTTSSNSSETITVPVNNGSGSASNSNSSSVSDNGNNVPSPTTRADIGNLSGTATYQGTFSYYDSAILSRAGEFWRSGVFTLNADFDQQKISGNASLDRKSGRFREYRQIENWADLNFNETTLFIDQDGDIAFKGQATGVVNDVLDATYNGASAPYDVSGTYNGHFSGASAENVTLGFDVKSPEDSRVGAYGMGSGTKQ